MTKPLFDYDEMDLIDMAKQCKIWSGGDGLESYLHDELLKATLPAVDTKDKRLWGKIEEVASIAKTKFPLLFSTKEIKVKGGSRWSAYTGAICNTAEKFRKEEIRILPFYKPNGSDKKGEKDRTRRKYYLPHVIAAMVLIENRLAKENPQSIWTD